MFPGRCILKMFYINIVKIPCLHLICIIFYFIYKDSVDKISSLCLKMMPNLFVWLFSSAFCIDLEHLK